MPRSPDPYETLGVARAADADTIKRAYRRATLQHHPDRNPDDAGAAERFRAATEAFELLSDPERRREYDATGRRSPADDVDAPADADDLGGEDLVDVIERLFGSSEFRRARPHVRDGSLLDLALGTIERLLNPSTATEDVRASARAFVDEAGAIDVVVPFHLAERGGPIELLLPSRVSCSLCAGSGTRVCPRCRGQKRMEVRQGNIRFFGAPCAACMGTGSVRCEPCKGLGVAIADVPAQIVLPQRVRTGHVLELVRGNERRRIRITVAGT